MPQNYLPTHPKADAWATILISTNWPVKNLDASELKSKDHVAIRDSDIICRLLGACWSLSIVAVWIRQRGILLGGQKPYQDHQMEPGAVPTWETDKALNSPSQQETRVEHRHWNGVWWEWRLGWRGKQAASFFSRNFHPKECLSDAIYQTC